MSRPRALKEVQALDAIYDATRDEALLGFLHCCRGSEHYVPSSMPADIYDRPVDSIRKVLRAARRSVKE